MTYSWGLHLPGRHGEYANRGRPGRSAGHDSRRPDGLFYQAQAASRSSAVNSITPAAATLPCATRLATPAAEPGVADPPPRRRPRRQDGDVRALPARGPRGGAVHGARPRAGAAAVQGAECVKAWFPRDREVAFAGRPVTLTVSPRPAA